jgi:hypothetical protein
MIEGSAAGSGSVLRTNGSGSATLLGGEHKIGFKVLIIIQMRSNVEKIFSFVIFIAATSTVR